MNMWMHVHGIKTRKHEPNPNLKPCEIRIEIEKIRVSELDHAHTWTSLHAHNQACARSQDYAHVGFSPETLATQKLK